MHVNKKNKRQKQFNRDQKKNPTEKRQEVVSPWLLTRSKQTWIGQISIQNRDLFVMQASSKHPTVFCVQIWCAALESLKISIAPPQGILRCHNNITPFTTYEKMILHGSCVAQRIHSERSINELIFIKFKGFSFVLSFLRPLGDDGMCPVLLSCIFSLSLLSMTK